MQGNPAAASDATHAVNAMRAAAAEREWAARWGDGGGMVGGDATGFAPRRLRASLIEFDPKYSLRSCVVVGRPESRVGRADGERERRLLMCNFLLSCCQL